MLARALSLLFSSAGRRVELMRCFRKWAHSLGIDVELIAVDVAPGWSPACQFADSYFEVPYCDDLDFPKTILEICEDHYVDLLVPTIDPELPIYAKNREAFEQAGTYILLPPGELVSMARDKADTAKMLSDMGISVPETWPGTEVLEEEPHAYPLIAKPINGSGSAGVKTVSGPQELKEVCRCPDYVVQKECQGREFTVHCFFVPELGCVSAVPYWRKKVRDGEVCFGQTERVPQFKEVGDRLAEHFPGLSGVLCFQAFLQPNGDYKVFEINARFGGGYPLCDRAGGTFAKWILQQLIGQEPDYHDDWQEGLRMLRYDAAVFV